MWDGTPDSFIIINGLCLKNQVKHKSVLVNFPLKNAVFLIKKNTASGKAEELRIHDEVQPLIWHALFVALLLAEERQLSPQTLGYVSRRGFDSPGLE